jgi:FdhD protein
VAEEAPIGFVYNGFPHAVMMATPAALDDFAVGFSLTEGLIDSLADIRATSARPGANGVELAIELAPECFARFLRRRRIRSLRGHTGCGVCGIEEIAQLDAARRTPPAHHGAEVRLAAVRRAVADLRESQPLSRLTRCAHAATWADRDGRPVLVREDIGRHNALDKLIGAALRENLDTSGGFCLVTSRCSYEMVQKAVAAGWPVLVSLSAPTSLAIRTAEHSRLTLIALDREGDPLVYSGQL